MAELEDLEVVLASNDRATVRVGDLFLKIDVDPARSDHEVEAMALAPVPTAQVLWRKPPALALAKVPGVTLGCLDREPTAVAAWTAVGAALRTLHDAPLPPWPGKSVDELARRLTTESDWLVANEVLPINVIRSNQQLAEAALQPWTPAFTHGDLHLEHVFIDDGEVAGIIDWSEAAQGDAHYDLACLTLAHPERLEDLLAGYGTDVDQNLVRAWRSWRCLTVIRWLVENGYGDPDEYPEVAALRSQV